MLYRDFESVDMQCNSQDYMLRKGTTVIYTSDHMNPKEPKLKSLPSNYYLLT